MKVFCTEKIESNELISSVSNCDHFKNVYYSFGDLAFSQTPLPRTKSDFYFTSYSEEKSFVKSGKVLIYSNSQWSKFENNLFS